MKFLRIILWLAVIAVGGLVLFDSLTSSSSSPSGADDRQILMSSGDSLGGPFTLTSHQGETVQSSDFAGKYQLIYFGYSFCPDVCPIELTKISRALTKLEKAGTDISAVQPLFITVDPERDTVAELAKFMTGFHPSFIGLTGPKDAIASVAKDYKIYYSKANETDDGFYLMNHSNVILLMDKQGKFLKLYSALETPTEIAADLQKLVATR